MHEFEELETAALTALEPLKAAGLKTLELLAGQLAVKELESITQQYPFVYVKAGSLKSKIENRVDRVDVPLLLFVGDRNERGGSAPTLGDTTSPGVYALLEGARNLLNRQRIAAGWTPPERRREECLAYDPKINLCVYVAEYRVWRRK